MLLGPHAPAFLCLFNVYTPLLSFRICRDWQRAVPASLLCQLHWWVSGAGGLRTARLSVCTTHRDHPQLQVQAAAVNNPRPTGVDSGGMQCQQPAPTSTISDVLCISAITNACPSCISHVDHCILTSISTSTATSTCIHTSTCQHHRHHQQQHRVRCNISVDP